MKKIKSGGTKPERELKKSLRKYNIKYTSKISKLEEKPDIILKKKKVAIYIDGEFWHGYNWKDKKKKIKSNRDYWIPKIDRNIKRDRKNNRSLRKKGWKVLRFWQHQIQKDVDRCIQKIKQV